MSIKYFNEDNVFHQIKLTELERQIGVALHGLFPVIRDKLKSERMGWYGSIRRDVLGYDSLSTKFEHALKTYLTQLVKQYVFTLGSGAFEQGYLYTRTINAILRDLQIAGICEILKQEFQAFNITESKQVEALTQFVLQEIKRLLKSLTFTTDRAWVNQAKAMRDNMAKVVHQHTKAKRVYVEQFLAA